MAYTTAANIGTALNIEGEEYSAQLTGLAASASNWIDQYCNLPANGFAVAVDSTRQYGPDDVHDGYLQLDLPLLTVTSVVNGDGTVLANGQYRTLPLNAQRAWMITPNSGYAWQWSNDGLISITGKFGWSAMPPAAVVEACTMLAGWMFKRYQAALQDATANMDLGQLVYSEAIPKQVTALLTPFRSGKRFL